MLYADRRDAGNKLADELMKYRAPDAVVLALPRGGVVLGQVAARRLQSPLGLVLVKKISSPLNPEYALGAAAEGGVVVYDQNEVAPFDKTWLMSAEAAARDMIEERRTAYFGNGVGRPKIHDKTVIIVDDGMATGLTMEAAVMYVREHRPKKIVVAVPVASPESVRRFDRIADEVVLLNDPVNFLGAVGTYYREFNQVNDREVIAMLQECNHAVQR